MSSAAFVDEAREISGWLVSRETRGPGDTDNAMRRVEQRYGIPHAILWACRYRPPKNTGAAIFVRLREAYQAETDRQQRLLAHEIELAKAARPDAFLVRAAVAVAAPDYEPKEDES